jgi:hypothetical protein
VIPKYVTVLSVQVIHEDRDVAVLTSFSTFVIKELFLVVREELC